MSEQIGLEAILEDKDFLKAVEGYNKSIDGMEKKTALSAKSITKGLGSLGQGFLGFGATVGKALIFGTGAVVASLGAVGVGIVALAAQSADLETIEKAFEGIATSAGKSAEEVLGALQTQSAGMITNRDLMQTYNLAAQLVGETFANQLPDAMGFLGKVAVATGEDMGYMLDSLVRGVGRLSPMILDNLGIQVNLTEANEAYAESIGVAVSELTKEQQQAALMNQVLGKLEENTAAMPDVVGSAAQSFASLKTQFANLKDELGKRLLPVVQPFLDILGDMGEKAIPKILDFLQPWIDKMSSLANIFKLLITGDFEGGIFGMFEDDPFIEKLFNLRSSLLNFVEQVAGIFTGDTTIEGFFKSIQDVVLQVLSVFGIANLEINTWVQNLFAFVSQVVNWFTVAIPTAINFLVENWDAIKGAIIAVSAVLAGAGIIATIAGIVAAINPVSVAIAAILGVVALLGAAWSENWGGIRDSVTLLWEESLKPIFMDLQAWLAEKIPLAIEAGKVFWTETLLPAIQDVWNWIVTVLIPTFGEIVDWLAINVPIAIETAKTYWEDTLKPALETVWEFITTNVIPIFQDVATWLGENIPVAIETAKSFWEETLKPALETVWSYIVENIVPVFQDVVAWLQEEIPTAIETAKDFWENTLQPALENVWEFIDENIVPILEELTTIFSETLRIAVEGLALLWEETLYPALEDIWEFIQDSLLPILNDLWVWFNETIVDPIANFIEGMGLLEEGVEKVAGWMEKFHSWLSKISTLLENFSWGELGEGAIPDSPPKLAQGFSMIISEVKLFNDEITNMGRIIGSELSNIEDLGEFFDAAGKLSGIGRGFASKYKEDEIDPLLKSIESIDEELEELQRMREEGFTSQQGVEDFLYRQNQLMNERNSLQDQFNEKNEKLQSLLEKQAQLDFLQQQLNLLDFVTEQGLDPAEVFEGFTFGLEASTEDLIGIIDAAMSAVIEQANESLGISSPSKVFAAMGENVGQSFISSVASALSDFSGMRGENTNFASPALYNPTERSLTNNTTNQTLNANFDIRPSANIDIEVLRSAVRTVIQEEFSQ